MLCRNMSHEVKVFLKIEFSIEIIISSPVLYRYCERTEGESSPVRKELISGGLILKMHRVWLWFYCDFNIFYYLIHFRLIEKCTKSETSRSMKTIELCQYKSGVFYQLDLSQ